VIISSSVVYFCILNSCACSSSAADPGLPQASSCSQCLAYQCIDWSVGSVDMKRREASFKARTGIDVYLGVGSLGGPRNTAGFCYRLSAASYEKDIIVQIVNEGGDVNSGNVDLQMGDGGYGIFNGCASPGTNFPQFDGTTSQWGQTYGGWSTIEGCNNLPKYPHCRGEYAKDDMQELCRFSFLHGFRLGAGKNIVADPVYMYM